MSTLDDGPVITMAPPLPGRYDVGPLARRLGVTLGEPGRPDDGGALHGRIALADHLDVSPSTVARMIACGLTEAQADRAAIRIGLHPALLWPTWWATELHVDEDDAAWFGDDPPLEEV